MPEDRPGRGAGEREFDAFYSASVGRLVGQLYAMTGDLAEPRGVAAGNRSLGGELLRPHDIRGVTPGVDRRVEPVHRDRTRTDRWD